MGINNIGFSQEIASIYQSQLLSANGVQNASTQKSEETSDRDSYIPSMAASADQAIPSGIYGANAMMVGETGQSELSGNSSDSQEGSVASQANASEGTVGGAGGAGGSGGGSGSSEETSTSVVTINGQTYLETTTTDENGNTTVTRTLIGTEAVDPAKGIDDGTAQIAGPSPAAQALAAL